MGFTLKSLLQFWLHLQTVLGNKQPPSLPPSNFAPTPAPTRGVSLDPRPPTRPVVNLTDLINNINKGNWTRINAGGEAFTDQRGRQWKADSHFESGRASVCTKPGSVNPLYCTQRFFRKEDFPARYSIPVKNGVYTVRLHFAETYYNIAFTRRFSVWLEGSLLVAGLDILTRVKQNEPLIIENTASVEDGFLEIEFLRNWGNPIVSGIELLLRSTSVKDVTQAPIPSKPTAAPVKTPTKVPISPPTPSPILRPPVPTTAPVLTKPPQISTKSPVAAPGPKFQDILINCGGDSVVEASGDRVWAADEYFIGGYTFANGIFPIENSVDDDLYQTERVGACSYEIPVPSGEYEIILHFAEIYFNETNGRRFNMGVEGNSFEDVDIVALAGKPFKAITIEVAALVEDGFVSIDLTDAEPKIDQPKISAIEIKKLADHLAHAVPETDGPYSGVDLDNSGTAKVAVDGSASHTHGIGLSLISWEWKEGPVVIGKGPNPVLDLTVGEHTVFLTVTDSGGNSNTVGTSITVLPFSFPAITSLSPSSGTIAGNQQITISGSGFTHAAADTTVYFGDVKLSGDSITIADSSTITVQSPKVSLGAPVYVSVETPLGKSNPSQFTYEAASKIKFNSKKLYGISSPTVATFSPNGDLYVGNMEGQVARLTLNDDFTEVTSKVLSVVSKYRPITGLAFDPMDTTDIPSVYVSSNYFFHGESQSTYGNAINGKVHKVSGANLDKKEDIITGLPVSDHDHGVNGLEFGDNGQLYILVGGNTNGGRKGQLSGSQQLEESYYSAATLVASLSDPNFDGTITYHKADGGKPISGKGIEVFASGIRNGYGITLHSNGLLYGTDNGPNVGYGDMQTSCDGGFVPDVQTNDRLNILEKGHYYGHPNPIRAKINDDPRQCTFRQPNEQSDDGYSAPLMIMPSSTDGLIEYRANYFDAQMQNNLIASKYTGPLYRIILSEDGRSTMTDFPIKLVGDGGLDVTQTPNGHLVEVRFSSNSLWLHTADEKPTDSLFVHSVFPYRGGEAGGNTLSIYGVNFKGKVAVTVGGKACPLKSSNASKITCVLPGGSGSVDVVVSGSSGTYKYQAAYRYISGIKR